MPDPLRQVNTWATPQNEQADPRQVPNSTGTGWGFKTGDETRLHRFLTLGTESGTFYASERKITRENADLVLDWARRDAAGLAQRALDVSAAGRAPRNNAALFALAAAASFGSDSGRKHALGVLPLVARTGTHLYTFTAYAELFRGWGRGLRRAVCDWYLQKDADQLAYQMIKYRQRDGWKHRDLLRLAHPGTSKPEQRALFDFACGRTPNDSLPRLAQAFLQAQAIDREEVSAKAKSVAYSRLLASNPGLPWEALPDQALTMPDVWTELIGQGLPQTALMRQLPRLTGLGVLSQLGLITQVVTDQLADAERLRKARVHPIAVLLALRTYASGHSLRGGSSWEPVARVCDALDAAFYAAYGAVEPAGKRTMVALDVSGSMSSSAGGLPLSCREASVALALVTAATEPETLITGFTSGSVEPSVRRHNSAISALAISPRQRLDDAVRAVSNLPFGGTDCSLPMRWAQDAGAQVDTFLVVTDNETWAGAMHPHQALKHYRQASGLPARLAVAAMTPTDFTIADPDDPGSLDVSGFDSAVPSLLVDFSRGDI